MRYLIVTLFTIFSFAKIATSQLVIVSTPSWNSSAGSLSKYEKISGKWVQVGKTKRVYIGKRGLAWGIGLHKIPKSAKYIKKEGDKRSPAGIFELKEAYGYNYLNGLKFPYIKVNNNYHCVDDSNSKYYNKVIDSSKIIKDYKSYERMKFAKNYYKYVVAINHNHFNESGAVPYKGSCIFIHIKAVPTVGCTTFSKENDMLSFLKWLDKSKKPILIQAPKSEIKRLLKELN